MPVHPGPLYLSYKQLLPWFVRFFQSEAGRMTVQEFVAAQVSAHFMLHPVENDIAASVAAYYQSHPPASGRAPTEAEIQQAVDVYIARYGAADETALAAAVAAYLEANPPQDGAPGPAGQNATPAQVADAVQGYFSANPLAPLVAVQVETAFSSRKSTALPKPDGVAVAGNSTRFSSEDHVHPLVGAVCKDAKVNLTTTTVTSNTASWSKTYPADFWAAEPSVHVQPETNSPMLLSSAGKSYNATTRQWTVTVYFARINTGITVSVLGTTASLLAAPGTITFDYQAFEPN